MIGNIKKFFRAIAKRPIIGRPVRAILYIKKSPQFHSMVLDINHRVHEMKNHLNDIDQQIGGIDQWVHEMNNHVNDINQQISDFNSRVHETNNHINYIDQQISDINYRAHEMKSHIDDIDQHISDISLLIGGMGKSIDTIRQQQVSESDYLPKLLESLDYYENLKRSLPVALRHHMRKSFGSEN